MEARLLDEKSHNRYLIRVPTIQVAKYQINRTLFTSCLQAICQLYDGSRVHAGVLKECEVERV